MISFELLFLIKKKIFLPVSDVVVADVPAQVVRGQSDLLELHFTIGRADGGAHIKAISIFADKKGKNCRNLWVAFMREYDLSLFKGKKKVANFDSKYIPAADEL